VSSRITFAFSLSLKPATLSVMSSLIFSLIATYALFFVLVNALAKCKDSQ
jgi:hypothetical protein